MLVFESDRLACSIFTPLMLGLKETRCSTFPPGRGEFILQGNISQHINQMLIKILKL